MANDWQTVVPPDDPAPAMGLPGCNGDQQLPGCTDEVKKIPETPAAHCRPFASEASKDKAEKLGETGYAAPMFPDSEAMKEKVRAALTKPKYSVAIYYKDEGFFQQVARSRWFENITLFVIGFNALWIAIDTDNNPAEVLIQAPWPFIVVENAFCVYFTAELLIRFMAFRNKCDSRKDAWFVFDTCLVTMMVLETWVMTIVVLCIGGGSTPLGQASILRLFRLLRLSRMARMLRSMPELLILIKGMVAAFRSVCFVMILQGILMYIFAIAFTQLCEGSDVGEKYFPKVLYSMYSLLVHAVFLDDLSGMTGDILESTSSMKYVFLFVLLGFIGVASLMLMNMLIGILCEVVAAVSDTEKEAMAVSYVRDKMKEIIDSIDIDGDGDISKKEFNTILNVPEAAAALQEVGVDPVELVDFADVVFQGDDADGEPTLTFSKFMDVILSLRGSNTATVKDIERLSKSVRNTIAKLHDKPQNNAPVSQHRHIENPPGTLFAPPPSPSTPSQVRLADGNFHNNHTGDVVVEQPRQAERLSPRGAGRLSPRCVVKNGSLAEHTARLRDVFTAVQAEMQAVKGPGSTGSLPGSIGDIMLQKWVAQVEQLLKVGLDEVQALENFRVLAGPPQEGDELASEKSLESV